MILTVALVLHTICGVIFAVLLANDHKRVAKAGETDGFHRLYILFALSVCVALLWLPMVLGVFAYLALDGVRAFFADFWDD